VESVATFRTVKYCFKYIHKGPDRATLEYEHDEIKEFIDGRYIGAPEGTWQILHFDVHKQVPSIQRLQVRNALFLRTIFALFTFSTDPFTRPTHGHFQSRRTGRSYYGSRCRRADNSH
jgi:hypothetical protein